MNNFKQKFLHSLTSSFIRYFVMAAFVVGIELIIFALINSGLHITYLVATPVSMIVGIILNWYFSRIFVFKGSKHNLHVEFTLIVTTSLAGIGIQLAVTAICVQLFHLLPIIGKMFAILVTFFWNFWARKRYIFEFTPLID